MLQLADLSSFGEHSHESDGFSHHEPRRAVKNMDNTGCQREFCACLPTLANSQDRFSKSGHDDKWKMAKEIGWFSTFQR
jgi:hypothetical protein